MYVFWVGFQITDKQYKELKKTNFKIVPEAFTNVSFIGGSFKFEDLVPGQVLEGTKDDKYMVFKVE